MGLSMTKSAIIDNIDLQTWSNKSEFERLEILQNIAEIRAISVHNTHDDLQKTDGVFNRNVRIAASLLKLRHELKKHDNQNNNTQTDWLEFLKENDQGNDNEF